MSRKIAYDDMLFNKPATDRVKRLREEVINAMPIVCSERAKLVTESYRETVDKPLPIRRALALEKILRNISLRIWPDELIVGNHGSNGRRSAPIYPEYATKWLEEELEGSLQSREQDRFIVPEDVKADLLECFKYWENSNVFSYYRAMLPPETRKARDAYMFSRDLFERNGYAHN